jgi:Zn-dependent protease
MLNRSLRDILITIPVILVALTVHELAHAAVALACGDDTAKRAGRITLNPIKHVDPVGFLMLVVAGFGWAKPVAFTRENLRVPVRDEIFISLAGPLSNLVLALLGAVALRWALLTPVLDGVVWAQTVVDVLVTFCVINIVLAVFNALPVPPLDGSHLITTFLHERHAHIAAAITKYGFLVLVAMILIGRVTGYQILPIGRITDAVFGALLALVGIG